MARALDQRPAQGLPLHSLPGEELPVEPRLVIDGPRDVLEPEGLDVAEDLSQAPELVEVAAQELGGRIVVRVVDGRAGMEDLGVSGLDHLARQQLVLGVRHLAIGHPLPRQARDGAVHVREELKPVGIQAVLGERVRGAVEPLDVDALALAPRAEVIAHLARKHVAVARPRDVGAEHERDVVGLRESIQDRAEPLLGGGRRVLGQERHHVAARALDRKVASTAVRELRLGDLDHVGAVTVRDLQRAVRRARVDDEQLDGHVHALRANRAQDLIEVRGAVQYGDRDRDGPNRHRPRSAPLTFFMNHRTTTRPNRSGDVNRQESECS